MFATVAHGYVLSKPGWADLNSANLTPASGRQDRTVLPSASASFVCTPFFRSQAKPALRTPARLMLPRPPHPIPTSVTIMIRPSCGTGWREVVEMICPTSKMENFCEGGWTANFVICPSGNISLRATQRLVTIKLDQSAPAWGTRSHPRPYEIALGQHVDSRNKPGHDDRNAATLSPSLHRQSVLLCQFLQRGLRPRADMLDHFRCRQRP